jgi:hypothetical protein
MATKIFDDGGTEIGEIELSYKMSHVLDAGQAIVVIYHTPQLLRHILGEQNGTFTLNKVGDVVVAKDVAGLKRYAALQVAIGKARETA